MEFTNHQHHQTVVSNTKRIPHKDRDNIIIKTKQTAGRNTGKCCFIDLYVLSVHFWKYIINFRGRFDVFLLIKHFKFCGTPNFFLDINVCLYVLYICYMYIRLVLLVLLRLFASLMDENTDMFVNLSYYSFHPHYITVLLDGCS